jgi:flagellar motility protein MotE (MotC chaperone)
LLLQLQKKREEIIATEETMATMGDEVETKLNLKLNRTQDLWATQDQNHQ